MLKRALDEHVGMIMTLEEWNQNGLKPVAELNPGRVLMSTAALLGFTTTNNNEQHENKLHVNVHT